MKRGRIFIICGLLLGLGVGCKTTDTPSKSKKDPIIINLGDNEVYVSEFQYVYEKSVNNKDSLYERKSVRDYLDLFINFKLKVTEAQRLGIDTSQAFNQELQTYEQVLAKPYLLDQVTLDNLLQEAYQRFKQEVKAQHILLRVSDDAPPQDTLEVYNRMLEIRERALNGEDFAKLATEFSEDPSVKRNQGAIGYFTALQMVYPFETASYTLPINEISEIIRTTFGYHIVKVLDRRPSQGTQQVAHIMVQISKNAPKIEQYKAEVKINKAYEELEAGANWDDLCIKYSDDGPTKNKGGVLPEFKSGQVIPIFQETTSKLKQLGDYAAPVRSDFGWHIIKLVNRKSLEPFDKMKESLKQSISKDSRYQKTQEALINRLKQEYNFQENLAVLEEAINKSDDRLLDASWSYDNNDPLINKVLFSINYEGADKNYLVKDFFDEVYLKQVQKPQAKEAKHAMRLYYPNFVNESLINFERNNLLVKYPEYKSLIKEYREGMMLFQMMTDRVWQKAIQDTTGLKRYFANNRNRYQWGQRANTVIYEVRNQEVLDQLKSYLLESTYPVEDIQIDNIYFEKDDNTLTENSVNILKDLIQKMQADPSLSVEISGHADPAEQNSLAQDRVDPVLRYLNFKGIDLSRIISKEFGYTKPVSREDRSKNRRVEFKLFSSNKKTLETILNQSNANNLKVIQGAFQKGDNAELDQIAWKPGAYTLEKDGKMIYIEIADIKEPRPKEYDEARGFVITDYQKYLEQEWLEELKKKYPIEIKESVVEDLIQQ